MAGYTITRLLNICCDAFFVEIQCTINVEFTQRAIFPFDQNFQTFADANIGYNLQQIFCTIVTTTNDFEYMKS